MEKKEWTRYFDRQIRIPEWNQNLIEDQVGLCLGVGGIGCSIALGLVRLGVRKIFLVDRDIVDVHNLNRQVLFSKEDVGKPKVECAARALQSHNLRTEIIAVQIDALKEWKRIVELAKQSTVIFQGIDVGDYFDLACQSLALNLKIPYVLGGTFQSTITTDFIKPNGKPCWCCLSDVNDKSVKEKLLPHKIMAYDSLDFLPPDSHPTGASCIYVAATASNLMLSHFVQYLNGIALPSRTIFYFNTYDLEKWDVPVEPNCQLCGDSPFLNEK